MPRITVDYNFVVKSGLSSQMTLDDLEESSAKARTGLSRLKELTDNKKIGFPTLAYQDTSAIKAISKDLYRKFNDLIVIGIGGSALGLEAIFNAIMPAGYNSLSFSDRKSLPRCWLLDNVDPSLVNSVLDYCKQEDTFVLVISKSGGTVETAANFTIVMDWLKQKVTDIKKHVVAITDPSTGILRDYVNANDLRSLPLNSDVGGRFSVLSPVGLLPAAILGVDIDALLKGASYIVESDWKQVTTLAGIYMYYIDKKYPINVLMPYSSKLVKFSEWFCQLWGESLGKRYNKSGEEVLFGTTPVRAYGAVDQHSQLQLFKEGPADKLITFIGVNNMGKDITLKSGLDKNLDYLGGHKLSDLIRMELSSTEASLIASNRPSIRINMPAVDEKSLGQLFMLYQYVVAVIGLANDIDPFDQPGVEYGKEFAYGLLGRKSYIAKKEEFNKIYVKQDQFIV